MSTNFSANQYENSFAAKRLQNWQSPKAYKEHPSSKNGFTKPISNDRGHLLEGVPRSKKSPWGDFKGTWDPEMNCHQTAHCQTLTTLKSEGASCLNNQTKYIKKQLTSDLTTSNKKLDKVFNSGNTAMPNRSDSPLEMHQQTEEQPAINIASPVLPAVPDNSSPEFKAHSPMETKVPKSPIDKVVENSPTPPPLVD